jgi:hypothetical protein
MLLSSIFAVAIGLFILWIVLSFATIQIQEWISARLGKRARVIEDAIHEMLANPSLKAQFYDHPLIRGLTAGARKEASQIHPWFYRFPILRGFAREKRHLPSYIPSKQFATVLFDMIVTAATESSLIQMSILKIQDDLQNYRKMTVRPETILELDLLAEYARGAAATEAGTAKTNQTLDTLKRKVDEFGSKHPELTPLIEAILSEAARLKAQMDDILKRQPRDRSTLSSLRRGVAALSVLSPELSQTLNVLISDMEDQESFDNQELTSARQNIEKWFNDTMDRVSGIFRRDAETLALVIGIYLAVLLNIDMISFTNFLWREAFIRQALLENVSKFELPQEQFAVNPKQAMRDFRRQFIGLSSFPIGWSIQATEVPALTAGNCQLFPGEGQSFGIPMISTHRCISPPDSSDETNILLKLVGFILTAFAARLGAPLWFDIMKKLLRLR